MPTRQAQSTESSNPPLREWCYTVQILGKSWAGTYGNSPFIAKDSTAGDGQRIAHGGGEEGRITGGVMNGYTEADIRAGLDGMYVLKRTETDKDGKEQEIVTQTYRLLSLEPRTVISLM
jgi:hypothetical protein